MKLSYIISFCFILIGNYCFSQNHNEDLELFNKGNGLYELVYDDLYMDHTLSKLDTTKLEERIEYKILFDQKDEILERALEYFEKVIDEYPESKLAFRAMTNAALIATELYYSDTAINYYKKIINSNASDKEKGGIGNGLMAEPYALYKNRACKNLAEIYLTESNYKESIRYIDLIKKYPYQHFCGNEYAANEIYLATLYSKNYLGLNNSKKALEYSLPHALNIGLADNSEIFGIALSILESNYTKEELDSEIEKSIRSIKLKTRKGNTYGVTTFLGVKIRLWPEVFFIKNYTKEKVDFEKIEEYEKLSELEKNILSFKNSKFYQKITTIKK